MATYLVNGGKPLKGVYEVSGAKNSAPKMLIASLLSGGTCKLNNIPRISDSFKGIGGITALGGSVKFTSKNSVEIDCSGVFDFEIPDEAMSARQSLLFIGTVLSRMKKVRFFAARGSEIGDRIGKRPINRHLQGIKALGGKIEEHGDYIEINFPDRAKSTIFEFEKNTHGGTENMILASVFNDGKVVLKNAAAEIEVDNEIDFLNSMGAKIKRTKPREIEITGVEGPLSDGEITSIPDRIEAATAVVLSVLHGGNIKVKNVNEDMIGAFLEVLEEMGVETEIQGDILEVTKIKDPLNPVDIVTKPHPGFMTDWGPITAILLGVMADGRSSIHETIFEYRFNYLEEMNKMGVRYELYAPEGYDASFYNFNESEYRKDGTYAAYVWGPSLLYPTELFSHDVRSGMNCLLAALSANGQSIISDPKGHIERGYENIVHKLTNLGADIMRIN